MVSYYFLNVIFQVVLILCNISDIQCSKRTKSSPHTSSAGTPASFKYYSRGMEKWKTMKYMDTEGMVGTNRSPKLSTPEECARTCKRGAAPKTCYYNWTVELYHTFGGACDICSPSTNRSTSTHCQCIKADGVKTSGIIVVNRQLPGPAIEVCIGDMVVIDVKNMIGGGGTTIHWHGIYQMNSQYYDGVPHLTQCPIPSHSTFRYQFAAQNPGTHFWHSHHGLEEPAGVDGQFTIRMPIEDEPSGKLYDYDLSEHHMFIQDWQHDNPTDHIPGTNYRNVGQNPDNFLFNGLGQFRNPKTGKYTTTPLAVFKVKAHKRYRFRMVNGCSLICPVEIQIADHLLDIISLDGSDVHPETVGTITSFSAERVDFILKANQPVGAYWIHLRALGECASRGLHQHAILLYQGSKHTEPPHPRPSYKHGLPRGVVFNPVNNVCDGASRGVVCVKDLRNVEPIHERIYNSQPDKQLVLPFGFDVYEKQDLFGSNTFQRFVDPTPDMSVAAFVDGISYQHPPSPLLTQFKDIPHDDLCPDSHDLPARCDNAAVCHCAHYYNIGLNDMVEIIMVDAGAMGLSHPFHLHGYGYYVMGTGLLSKNNITSHNKAHALERHREIYPPKSHHPPVKDTLAIPSGGYAIFRFMADNPGWWILHCHFVAHYYNGMSVVLHVGEDSDLPPIPEGFPKCGNFKPKILKSNPKPRSQKQKDVTSDLLGIKMPSTKGLLDLVL